MIGVKIVKEGDRCLFNFDDGYVVEKKIHLSNAMPKQDKRAAIAYQVMLKYREATMDWLYRFHNSDDFRRKYEIFKPLFRMES